MLYFFMKGVGKFMKRACHTLNTLLSKF